MSAITIQINRVMQQNAAARKTWNFPERRISNPTVLIWRLRRASWHQTSLSLSRCLLTFSPLCVTIYIARDHLFLQPTQARDVFQYLRHINYSIVGRGDHKYYGNNWSRRAFGEWRTYDRCGFMERDRREEKQKAVVTRAEASRILLPLF